LNFLLIGLVTGSEKNPFFLVEPGTIGLITGSKHELYVKVGVIEYTLINCIHKRKLKMGQTVFRITWL
jgi:hypothetical protein